MLVGATIYAARGHLDLVVKAPDAGGRFVENWRRVRLQMDRNQEAVLAVQITAPVIMYAACEGKNTGNG